MSQNNRMNEELQRDRDEPGTTGQEGSGDAGRNPNDGAQRGKAGDEDKLASRNVELDTEGDDATRSGTMPSRK